MRRINGTLLGMLPSELQRMKRRKLMNKAKETTDVIFRRMDGELRENGGSVLVEEIRSEGTVRT